MGATGKSEPGAEAPSSAEGGGSDGAVVVCGRDDEGKGCFVCLLKRGCYLFELDGNALKEYYINHTNSMTLLQASTQETHSLTNQRTHLSQPSQQFAPAVVAPLILRLEYDP